MAETFLELRRELRTMTAKKRVDRIIERKDALKVVRALPVEDLYATLREVGLEDALEVIELASPKQVRSFCPRDAPWPRSRAAANRPTSSHSRLR